jgi:thiamine biosynthesis lipoprotein
VNTAVSASVVERRFRAMGSDAHLIVVDGLPGAIDRAISRIEDLERRWSRFIDTSEVCELNRRAGQPVQVSAETALLVTRATDAWRLTGGGFDPTVLGAMIRAGYTTNFLAPGERNAGASELIIGCTDIVVNGTTVTLPANTGFDAGGIGKGLAADLVLDEMLAAGAVGACVNMGGDLRVAGTGPDGGAWTIAVEHPQRTEPLAMLGMTAGAVATSTTLNRRWTVNGTPQHHLIDPWTGEPSQTDVVLCTVIAGEAWLAEVLAKAALLRGSRRAFDVIDGTDVHCMIVDRDGHSSMTAGFQAFTGGPLRHTA